MIRRYTDNLFLQSPKINLFMTYPRLTLQVRFSSGAFTEVPKNLKSESPYSEGYFTKKK